MSERWATFDCYGTLIDWERGISDTFRRLWPGCHTSKLLARYHEVEPKVEAGTDIPYRDVLARCLRMVADAEELLLAQTDELALAESLPSWPPFVDVPPALEELRGRGWRIAILSNTDPDLLEASIKNIGVDIDLPITASQAGSYKPAHGHWRTFFDAVDVPRTRYVHVAASPFHDLAPAAELGLTAVWINRTRGATRHPRAAELPDLTGLPDALDRIVPA